MLRHAPDRRERTEPRTSGSGRRLSLGVGACLGAAGSLLGCSAPAAIGLVDYVDMGDAGARRTSDSGPTDAGGGSAADGRAARPDAAGTLNSGVERDGPAAKRDAPVESASDSSDSAAKHDATDATCSSACGPTRTCCSGVCVDLQSDHLNCGACGSACNAGTGGVSEGCTEGRCYYVLADAYVSYPNGIALQGGNVYVTDLAGSVWTVPEDDDTVTTVYGYPKSPVVTPAGIAVDSENVYWTDPGAKVVMKTPLAGGKATVLASGQNNPGAIAIDATSVYWTTNLATSGSIMQVSIAGGTPKSVASAVSPAWVAVDASNLYWLDAGSAWGSSTVMQAPLGGGAPTTLASGQTGPEELALDGANVYWTAVGAVMKVPIGGGALTTLFSGGGSPIGIAVDATTVYWSDRSAKAIRTSLALSRPLARRGLRRLDVRDRRRREAVVRGDGSRRVE